MEYHVLDAGDIEPSADRPSERRSISEAAGLENLGCHRFDAAPGEQIPLSYHVHDEQEEIFYVLDGTLSVETPEGTYEVGRDGAFVAEPESPHRAFVADDADEPARVLAIGAPAVDDVRPYDPEEGDS